MRATVTTATSAPSAALTPWSTIERGNGAPADASRTAACWVGCGSHGFLRTLATSSPITPAASSFETFHLHGRAHAGGNRHGRPLSPGAGSPPIGGLAPQVQREVGGHDDESEQEEEVGLFGTDNQLGSVPAPDEVHVGEEGPA